MMNKTTFLLVLSLSAGLLPSAKAQGPQLPSCGNISILADSIIDGRQFQKGIYQLNTFGISCEEVVGLNGILGVVLGLRKEDSLPAPWSSLTGAVGAPKFSTSADIGFRLQKIEELPAVSPLPVQQLAGITSSGNAGSSAILKIGASSDLGLTSKQNFVSTDSIKISAAIIPQSKDEGQPAYIFVIAEVMAATPFYMRLSRLGEWKLWNGTADELLPAHTVSALENELRLQIYSGKLDAGFKLAFYLGYSTISSGKEKLIHYKGFHSLSLLNNCRQNIEAS